MNGEPILILPNMVNMFLTFGVSVFNKSSVDSGTSY